MAIKTDLNKSALNSATQRGPLKPASIQNRAMGLANDLSQGSNVIAQTLQTIQGVSAKNEQRFNEKAASDARVKAETLEEMRVRYNYAQQQEAAKAARKKAIKDEADARYKQGQIDATTNALLAGTGVAAKARLGADMAESFQAGAKGSSAGTGLAILDNAYKYAQLQVAEEMSQLTPEQYDEYDPQEQFLARLDEEMATYGTDVGEVSEYAKYDQEGFNKVLKGIQAEGYSLGDDLNNKREDFRKDQMESAFLSLAEANRQQLISVTLEDPGKYNSLWKMNEDLASQGVVAPIRLASMMKYAKDMKDYILADESDMSAEQFEAIIRGGMEPQANKTPGLMNEEDGQAMIYIRQVKSHLKTKPGLREADDLAVMGINREIAKIESATQDSTDPYARSTRLTQLTEHVRQTQSEATFSKVMPSLRKKTASALGKGDALMEAGDTYHEVLKADITSSDYLQSVKGLKTSYGLSSKQFTDMYIKRGIELDFKQEPEKFMSMLANYDTNSKNFSTSSDTWDAGSDFASAFESTPINSIEEMTLHSNNLTAVAGFSKSLHRDILRKSPKARDIAMYTAVKKATGIGDERGMFNSVFKEKDILDETVQGKLRGKASQMGASVAKNIMSDKTQIKYGFFFDTDAKFAPNPQNLVVLEKLSEMVIMTTKGKLTEEQVSNTVLAYAKENVGYSLNNEMIQLNDIGGKGNGIYSDLLRIEVYAQNNMKSRVHALVQQRGKSEEFASDENYTDDSHEFIDKRYTEFYEYPDGDYTAIYGKSALDDSVGPVFDREGFALGYRTEQTTTVNDYGVQYQRKVDRNRNNDPVNNQRRD